MRIYAIVVGSKPKDAPYVAYSDTNKKLLAVFDSKKLAKAYMISERMPDYCYIVEFKENKV